MKAHLLQHLPFEGLGSIGPWLEEQGATIRRTRFFLGEPLPDVRQTDLVIVMGGTMSVNDEAAHPWLNPEKQFLREAFARGTPVLGVCLGAQLIASALGARVRAGPVKEIGWYPIHAVPTCAEHFPFPPECTVFHWHGETFDVPEQAIRLARSAGCENQAFQWNHNVIALQFHLETTPESAAALIDNCRRELIPGPYVQSEAELRAVPAERYAAINALMNNVLAYLL